MFALETQGLTKYYSGGKVKALEEFSLQVEQGKIFSLLGPNGAGKTTLIKLLLGIVFPTRGTAQILGKSIGDHTIHHDIGYLAENHHFPDFLSAKQILYYYGKMSGVPANDLKNRIPELLSIVKLSEWENTKIKNFSKGMLQRLGIAQALINDPQILFLDEPTDGIDPVGRREVRELLTILKNEGKTIFLNSHLLSEVERVSDEIAILKNGRLLQKGPVQDFINIKEQYQIKLTDGAELIDSVCGRLNISLSSHNGYHIVNVADELQLNKLLDQLRKGDNLIKEVIPRKISLEEFFIDVVEDKPETRK
ncbi:MAG: ATP-binding cassette domain-containing protein [Calditrichaceae bacterium]